MAKLLLVLFANASIRVDFFFCKLELTGLIPHNHDRVRIVVRFVWDPWIFLRPIDVNFFNAVGEGLSISVGFRGPWPDFTIDCFVICCVFMGG